MVHFGTDAEGNIALYTRADRLRLHVKGAGRRGLDVDAGNRHQPQDLGPRQRVLGGRTCQRRQ